MINLVLTCGIWISHLSQPDSLKIKLYYRDQCTDSVYSTVFYELRQKNSNIVIRPDSKTEICILPSKGVYELRFLTIDYPLTYTYSGQTADTLNAPKLFFAFPGVDSHKMPCYASCDKKADGNLIDYFKKGIKRAEGRFKHGKLVGKMTYYDLNGNVIKYEFDRSREKSSKPK